MPTFAEFIADPGSRGVHLLEWRPRYAVAGWEPHASLPSVWQAAFSRWYGPSGALALRGMYAVHQAGVTLTEQANATDVNATADSWYWDTAAGILYVNPVGGNPDESDNQLIVETILRFGTVYVADGDTLYDGRLEAGVPASVQKGINHLTGGDLSSEGGKIRLRNDDGLFDTLMHEAQIEGSRARLLFGGEVLAVSDYIAHLTGLVTTASLTDQHLELTVRPLAAELDVDAPANVFDRTKQPGLIETVYGRPLPLLVGRKTFTPVQIKSKEQQWHLNANGVDQYATVACPAGSSLRITGSILLYFRGVWEQYDGSSFFIPFSRGADGAWSWWPMIWADGSIGLTLSSDGSTAFWFRSTPGRRVITPGKLFEALLSYDITNKAWHASVNGHELDTSYYLGTPPAAINAGSADFTLFRYFGAVKWGGRMDEIIIAPEYGTAPPTDKAKMAAWWDFAGGLIDRSGKGNHLRGYNLTGAELVVTGGSSPIRQAVALNASSRYYRIAHASQAGLAITGALALQAEIKPASVSGIKIYYSKSDSIPAEYAAAFGASWYATYATGSSIVTSPDAVTFQARIRINTWTNGAVILSLGANNYISMQSTGRLRINCADGGRVDSSVLSTATWYLITWRLRGAGSPGVVVDGVDVGTGASGDLGLGAVGAFRFGADSAGNNKADVDIDWWTVKNSYDTSTGIITGYQHKWDFNQTLAATTGGLTLTATGTAAWTPGTAAVPNYAIRLQRNGARVELKLSANGSAWVTYATPNNVLNAGEKTLVTVSYLPGFAVRLWTGDTLELESAVSLPASLYASTADVTVGAGIDDGTVTGHADGELASLAVLNAAVTSGARLTQFVSRWRFDTVHHYDDAGTAKLADDLGGNHLTAYNIAADHYNRFAGGDVYQVADPAQTVTLHEVVANDLPLGDGDYTWDADYNELTVHGEDVGAVTIEASGLTCGDIPGGVPGRAVDDPAHRDVDAILWLLRGVAGVEEGLVDLESFRRARVDSKEVAFYLDGKTSLRSLLVDLCRDAALLDLVIGEKIGLKRFMPEVSGIVIEEHEIAGWEQGAPEGELLAAVTVEYGDGETVTAENPAVRRDRHIDRVLSFNSRLRRRADAELLAKRLAFLGSRSSLDANFTVNNLRLATAQVGDSLLIRRSRAGGPDGSLTDYPVTIREITKSTAAGTVKLTVTDWFGALAPAALMMAAGAPDHDAATEMERITGGFIKTDKAGEQLGQQIF